MGKFVKFLMVGTASAILSTPASADKTFGYEGSSECVIGLNELRSELTSAKSISDLNRRKVEVDKIDKKAFTFTSCASGNASPLGLAPEIGMDEHDAMMYRAPPT